MKKLSLYSTFFIPCLLALSLLPALSQERPAFRMPRAIYSPEILPDNKVTFRFYAKDAQTVAISGDWMPGYGNSEPLIKNDTGMWSITLGPLKPEMLTYGFILDGVRILDPSNPRVVRDGTRNLSMLLVPGTESDLYEVKDVPHGNLAKVWYPSPTLNLTRRMYVYTPTGYSEGKTEYPVLYLLHGDGGDEDAWTTLGRACQIMDNLIAQGKAKPMLVVMTNGNPGQSASPGEGPAMKAASGNPGDMGRGKFEASLVNDVIPYIESHYRVLKGKNNRAVSGLSMGGMQTMNLSTTFPEMFSYYGVMSMGLVDNSARGIPPDPELDKKIDLLKNSGYKLYWIACGTDDFLYTSAKNLLKKLDEHQFKYVYRESTGGHTWANWRIYLSELAPQLFK